MNPIDFIHRNTVTELEKLGYDKNTALTGADMAVDHYKRCSQASRKGRIFDDCLYVAKQWVGKNKTQTKN